MHQHRLRTASKSGRGGRRRTHHGDEADDQPVLPALVQPRVQLRAPPLPPLPQLRVQRVHRAARGLLRRARARRAPAPAPAVRGAVAAPAQRVVGGADGEEARLRDVGRERAGGGRVGVVQLHEVDVCAGMMRFSGAYGSVGRGGDAQRCLTSAGDAPGGRWKIWCGVGCGCAGNG